MTDSNVPRDDLFVRNVGDKNANPTGIGFWALVREDLETNYSNLFSQGFWALFWHRFGNWRMGLPYITRKPATLIYRVMYKVTQWVCGIDLPYTVRVGRRVRLEHFGGMILMANSIGDDVTIRQNTTFGIARTKDLYHWPVIGNGVDIGVGAVILGKVIVGDNALIGANALVINNVAAATTVGGVPAKPLHSDSSNEKIELAAQKSKAA